MTVRIIMEFAGVNDARLRNVNPAFPNGFISNVVGFTGAALF